MAIPKAFNSNGVLDPGTYAANFADIRKSILILGDGTSSTWDKDWRLELVARAEVLVNQLFQVGIQDVFLDGSFVEDKDHPNDIDGYFDPHLAMDVAGLTKLQSLVSQLNNLDPRKVWNWDPHSRKKYPEFSKAQLPMWWIYRVELFPHLDQLTGIKDKHGNDLTFPSAFRQSRHDFTPKGIIQVIQ